MQLRAAFQAGLKTLQAEHVPSAELAAELLLMHTLGCDRSTLYTHLEMEIAPDRLDRYFGMIAERATGKPTQYITGHQEFWGLDFEVTPDVLIPRPETEHIIEAVLELSGVAPGTSPAHSGARNGPRRNPNDRQFRIVDVGTGSGCIALALAHEFPNAKIFASDISAPALAVARRNAERLGLTGRVEFLEGDLLGPFIGISEPFDFVVSNPPYVGRKELDQVQREVRDFEPRIAVGGLQEGDEIYRRLFPQAHQLLNPGGYVVVEIGYNMRERVLALLGEGWTEIEVRSDLAGIPRVISLRKCH